MTTDPGREAAARAAATVLADFDTVMNVPAESRAIADALAAAGLLAALPGPPDEGAGTDLRARIEAVCAEYEPLATFGDPIAWTHLKDLVHDLRAALAASSAQSALPGQDGAVARIEALCDVADRVAADVYGYPDGSGLVATADLRAALPGQEPAAWTEGLRAALALIAAQPQPVSLLREWLAASPCDCPSYLGECIHDEPAPGQEPAAGTEGCACKCALCGEVKCPRCHEDPAPAAGTEGATPGDMSRYHRELIRSVQDPGPAPGQVTAADTPPAEN